MGDGVTLSRHPFRWSSEEASLSRRDLLPEAGTKSSLALVRLLSLLATAERLRLPLVVVVVVVVIVFLVITSFFLMVVSLVMTACLGTGLSEPHPKLGMSTGDDDELELAAEL